MKLSTFIPFGVVLAAFAADALVIQNRDAPSVVSLPFERNPAASSSLVRYRRTRQILDDLSQSRPLLYTVTLQIGTPPQTVQLQLDTGSGDLVVETPSSDLCAANPQVCAVQGTYEANSSSTYIYLDYYLNVAYTGRGSATGDNAEDNVMFDGAVLQNFQIGIMYKTTVMQGILGLGYFSYPAADRTPFSQNFPQALVASGYIASPAYSLWLNDIHGSSGQILFGGIDTAKFKGHLVTFDLNPQDSVTSDFSFIIPILAVTLTNASGVTVPLVGGVAPKHGLLDSGSSLTYLPQDLAQSIYNMVGVTMDTSGNAIIDCSMVSSPITINFVFQGITIVAPLSQYVLPVNNNVCLFGIGIQGNEPFSTLGDTTLSSMYVVYDIGNNQVSLAETVFGATTSHIVPIKAGPGGIPNDPGVSDGTTTSAATTTSDTTTTSTSTTTSATITTTTTTGTTSSTPTGTPFTYSGCFTDNVANRALSKSVLVDSAMTVEKCASFCSGYMFFGVEYGHECYCDNTQASSSVPAPDTECSEPCAGNSTETCGAPNRINVYTNIIYKAPSNPVVPNFPYLSCYTDSPTRTLNSKSFADNAMTVEMCGSYCAGYKYFGVEYSRECYCGNSLAAGSSTAPEGDCSFFCSGNSKEFCGGGFRLSLYGPATQTTTGPDPSASPALSGYAYLGCYSDSVNARSLIGPQDFGGMMTLEKCASFCSQYPYFGVEFAMQCFCGVTLAATSTLQLESDCSSPCEGNASEICGAGNRLSLYHNPTVVLPGCSAV